MGFSRHAISHRVARGRLHRIRRGVFAVGSPELDQRGRWMAAVLACGPAALLSHTSAAALWGIRPQRTGPIHVSIPDESGRRAAPDLRLHRRRCLTRWDRRAKHGIPVTGPIRTLVDLALELTPARLEAAVNEADKLELVDPERLRAALEEMHGQPGTAALRRLLDRRTFVLTNSDLERFFLPIVRSAGLPLPETGVYVNGFEVDFFWPDLGLVVETDGLRYHRTPAEQARDRLRDQTHAAGGLTPLRFTHAQIRFDQDHVRDVLCRVVVRLVSTAGPDCRRAA
jgi:Protein of unknown function (DUF559)